jgi:hypothetical protein
MTGFGNAPFDIFAGFLLGLASLSSYPIAFLDVVGGAFCPSIFVTFAVILSFASNGKNEHFSARSIA